MKVFTAAVLLFGVFVFFGYPEPSAAQSYTEPIGDHEVENSCSGLECRQATCRQLLGLDNFLPCPAYVCQRGYICEQGYIREWAFGRCIPRSECHA